MMTKPQLHNENQVIPFASLASFFCITLVLSWGILALFVLLPSKTTAMFGELTGQHPLFYLAVWAPAIAACILVARKAGTTGFRQFLGRVLMWRCSIAWYVFLIVGIPLVFYVGAFIKGDLFNEPFAYSIPGLIHAIFFMAIKGPVEELGWRGFALPLLQQKLAPFWASLVLGSIWGFWHYPAFLLAGTQQSAWSFTPFLVGVIATSVIMTHLFNASRGSILLVAFFHFQLINPVWPDAQPYDTGIFVLVATILVCFNRKSMFTRKLAVTDVVPKKVHDDNHVY